MNPVELLGKSFPSAPKDNDDQQAPVVHAPLAKKEPIERRAPSFQLRNLIEIFLLQFCGGSLMQFAVGQLTFGFFDRLDEVVGQGSIIGAADMRIGGCLRIPTAGDQQFLDIRLNDIVLSFASSRNLAQSPTNRPA